MQISQAVLKPASFIIRDFLIDVSYRFNFVLQFVSIFITTLMFFFLSELIGSGVSNQLRAYGGDYFAFALVGIAFVDYLSVSLSSFSSQIRSAQTMGTLEALLVTPTSVPSILFSSCLYNFTFTSLRIIVYMLVGVLIFGVRLHFTSLTALAVITLLTILSFIGIGLFSAAFIIVFKQGSPLNWVMNISAGLLGGVIYPVSVLPSWLQPYSYLLPITHALEAIRQLLLNGASFAAVYKQILILSLFAGILLPLGLTAFGYGLKMAKKEGSLIHY
jgi:ABC-2 type transport system permease protein